jgi:hypothetical protein
MESNIIPMANKTSLRAKDKGTVGSPLRATHGSPDRPLKLGNAEIQCYVLSGGMRVLSGRGMQRALGFGIGQTSTQSRGDILKSFLANLLAKPEINALAQNTHGDLLDALQNPIRFVRPGRGGRLAVGYEATILADVCDLILAARQENLLTTDKEKIIAKECEILTRSFAKVGIIALVDEATGYQEDRARDALADILKQFISDELAKWAKTFPDEFYRQLFKLRNIQYSEFNSRKPQYIGKITNDIVYERLAPGVLEGLRKKEPKINGRRKHKLFQWLTEDVEDPKLREHLSNLIILMKASPNWTVFYRLLQRSLPKYSEQMTLALDDDVNLLAEVKNEPELQAISGRSNK